MQVLPLNGKTLAAFRKANVFSDSDLRVRLAAVIAMADMKPSAESFSLLTAMKKDSVNTKDRWINKALDAAIGIHNKGGEKPVSTTTKKPDQVITISVIKDQMKFSRESITVKAGTTIRLVFTNPDFMQHNLLILKPGSQENVGAAADELARASNGAELQYTPKMPEVLFSTPLVNPQKSHTLTIKVPATPGDYPYICSFPGQWRTMNGIMKVVLK